MFLLYSVLIRAYGFTVSLAALISPKARLWKDGRKDQLDKIKSIIKDWKNHPKVMIHSASFGEYEMAKPIIDLLKEDKETRFIISFFSPSGYVNIDFDDSRFLKIYLPLDTVSNQKKLIEMVNPDAVVFIKYDFWFNLLKVLIGKNIPYYFTSLHLNEDSYLFRAFMKPFTNLLRNSRSIYCHNKGSKDILEKHNFSNLKVLGDTRIEQVLKNKTSDKGQLVWQNKNKLTIGIGSLIASEYGILTDIINEFPFANIMVAPHDVDTKDIATLRLAIREGVHLYSQGKSSTERIAVIDTLGDLKYLYRVCDVAYIGAGFEKGPHNILEPLVYGIPTCCGNNVSKFPMAQRLSKQDILTVIEKPSQVTDCLKKLIALDRSSFKNKTEVFFDGEANNLITLTEEIKSNFHQK